MSSFVFIDSRVANIDGLIAALEPDAQFSVLDAETDGVEQIVRVLAGVTDLDSIHIVSHGSTGTLYLGSTVFTATNLDEYRTELTHIGASLSQDGDILLYGCDVGTGISGQSFIENFARHTGADVAASTAATGTAVLGGDWVLEVSTGSIEVRLPFDAGVLEDYVYTLAADGSLDTTFDGDGKLTTAIGAGDDYALGLALQPDGKIVVVGYSLNGSSDFALARYNANGSLDSTFDGDGKLTTAIGSSADLAQGLALQPDSKIVVVGYSHNGTNFDFALARYNVNGSLDSTFDGDGKLTTAIGSSNDFARSLAVLPDGRIVVAGWSYNGANHDFALARYNTDGSLDTTFDGDGKLTTDIGAEDGAEGLLLQPDGKIVVVGHSITGANNDFALARYNANGSLDSTFDGDGKLTTTIGSSADLAFGLALQPDGKIVVVGYSFNGTNFDFALARYNANGSLDSTFDGDGKLTTAIGAGDDYALGLALQPDGKIVVVGYSFNDTNNDFALARYNANGSLDSTFDGDGKLTVAVGSGMTAASDVAIQGDGNIVVAGYSAGDFALIRVLGGGYLNLVGGPGDDTLNGSIGNDTLSGLGGDDTLSGGEGTDTADYSEAPGAVTVNLAAGSAAGAAGNDTLIDIENVIGSGFSDILIGSDDANALDGLGDADTMQGGVGNDTYHVDSLGDVVQEVPNAPQGLALVAPAALEGFIDTVIAAISFSLANVANVENLLLAAASAAAAGTGNELDNVLTGNELSNTLAGLAGNDTLSGGIGADTLDGGSGVDTAVYSGSRTEYTVANSITDHSVTGPEASDTLSNIERLQFSDKEFAIDLGLGQAAGNTVRVIGAAFDAPAIQQHPEWVDIGLQFFDSSMTMLQVCELVAQLMGQSNSNFVTTVFTNVVGSPPDPASLNAFVGLLQGSGGQMTQGQLLEIAANTDLNAVNINLVGLQVSGVEFG